MGIRGRGGRRWAGAAACALVALAASATPAQAERFSFAAGADVVNNGDVCLPVHVCQRGQLLFGAGKLAAPVGAAVLGDRVFVPEILANRVSVHDAATGEFLFAFGQEVGGPGTTTCTMATTCGVGAVIRCADDSPFPFPGCDPLQFRVARSPLQPSSITVVDGRLFVTETSNRVSVWEPDGQFVRAFGRGVGGPGVDSCTTECFFVNGGSSGAGDLWGPGSSAVTGGEAFVADNNRRVSVFDATTGAYKRAYGKDVGGPGVHVCTDPCAPGSDGGGVGTGPLDFVGSLAAAAGELLVADLNHGRVGVYDAATGAFGRAIGSGNGSGAGQLSGPSSLAIAGGELFVGEAGNRRVSVFSLAGGAFVRAVGRDVGGPGVHVCTTSCQAGTADEGGPGFDTPAAIAVGGGRLVVPDGLGATLTAVDAATGEPHYIAGGSVRTGGGNEAEICRLVCSPGRFSSAGGHLAGLSDGEVAGGELFVAEASAKRISVFDVATGRFVRAFGRDVGGDGVHTCTDACGSGTLGDGAGEIHPAGLAMAGGELFVSEEDNNRVSVFDPATGAFLRALGKGVGGDGVDVCTSSCRAGATGTGAGELDAPKHVAVTGGRVFVADYDNARVTVLDATTGEFVEAWGGGVDGAGGDVCTTTCQAGTKGGDGGELESPTGMAAADGEVFVAEDSNYRVSVFDAATGEFLRAYGKGVGGAGVDVCTTSCTNGVLYLEEAAGAGGLANPRGIKVVAGQLYVADLFNNRISVFDAASGTFLRAFGKDVGGEGVDTCTTTCTSGSASPAAGAGEMHAIQGLAVAPRGVFVMEATTSRYSAWSSSPDESAPETEITSGPSGVITDPTPSFGFTSPDATAVFECRVDSDSFRPCESVHTTHALRNGPHTFEVRAVDPAWNFDASAASREFTVINYFDLVMSDDPAGFWRFGELSGTTTQDSSGNDNDGLLQNGPVLGQLGAIGTDDDTAVRLDGVNDAIKVDDDATLDVGASFTAEAWVKRSSATKTHQLMLKGNRGLQLTIMPASGGNEVWLRKAGITTIARSSVGVPADGRYHHVVATMNGAGTARIYVDGADVTVQVPGQHVQAIENTATPLYFGGSGTTASTLDEFALYDRALTGAEVLEHFEVGAGPPPVS